MKIIEPSVKLYDEINPEEILRKLEVCGKVSRQSKLGDAEKFIRSIIKRGHESVLEHVSLTFKIVCDRAIMAELTRHRLASFTVESTRYVKYDELTVIQPHFWKDDLMNPDKNIRGKAQIQKSNWEEAVASIEDNYRTCLTGGEFYEGCGIPPEIARAVLPLCLATELYMTANLRELRTILKLRCSEKAHPQMRGIAFKILSVLHENLPVIVEDIWEMYKNECDSSHS